MDTADYDDPVPDAPPTTVTLTGLVDDTEYELQLFLTDQRTAFCGGCNDRTVTFTSGANAVTLESDPNNAISAPFGQFTIGKFIADGTTQTFAVTGTGVGPFGNPVSLRQVNAWQLRSAWIQNGGFERPPVAANTHNPGTPHLWTWAGPTGFVHNGHVFSPPDSAYWPDAEEGVQYVDIGNGAPYALSQSFTIDAASPPGFVYLLEWRDAAIATANTSLYRETVVDESELVLDSQLFDAAHGGTWTVRRRVLHLPPGIYTLTFAAQGPGGGAYDSLIDAVSLPEPGRGVSIAIGMMMLLTLDRARSRAFTRVMRRELARS